MQSDVIGSINLLSKKCSELKGIGIEDKKQRERREGYEVWKKEMGMGISFYHGICRAVLNRGIGKISNKWEAWADTAEKCLKGRP